MAAAMIQWVGFVVLVALFGGVASKMPRDGSPTKALLDWEQEKLEHDEKYCKDAIYGLLEKAEMTADKVWVDYIEPALKTRQKIIEQALGKVASKPIKEASELLFRAHRRAYAEIAPNIQRITDDFEKLAVIDQLESSGFVHKFNRALRSVETRLIRRINNYYYETVPKGEQKYRYGEDDSAVYYITEDFEDKEARELDDPSYYEHEDEDYELVFAEEFDWKDNADNDPEKLFQWERKQLMYDYQFIRVDITKRAPLAYVNYPVIHQIYAAVEKREEMINDAMDKAAVKTLEEARETLLRAHKKASDEIRPYLERAGSNLGLDVTDFEELKERLEPIVARLERGLDEYSKAKVEEAIKRSTN